MIKHFNIYLKESLGNNLNSINEDLKYSVDFKVGDKLICIKDTINFYVHGYNEKPDIILPIKKGEVKIVDGGGGSSESNGVVYFKDTISGQGAYLIKHFKIFSSFKKINRPDIDPYGEEDWGYKEINESAGADYELAIFVKSEKSYNELMKKLDEQEYLWNGSDRKRPIRIPYDGQQVIYLTYEHKLLHGSIWGYDKYYKNTIPNIYSNEYVSLPNKKLKKIQNLEIDPYGEEDWGYEEIKESKKLKYNIGDKVIVDIGFGNWAGVIFNRCLDDLDDFNSLSYCIKFEDKHDGTHQGRYELAEYPNKIDPEGKCYWVRKSNIKLLNKKLKKIERPDIDPFGEEDWGYEKIKNN